MKNDTSDSCSILSGCESVLTSTSSGFELRKIRLGFYHLAGLVLRGGESRLVGIFTDEGSLAAAFCPWAESTSREPKEWERMWEHLPGSPFQETSNWQLALELALFYDRLFVSREVPEEWLVTLVGSPGGSSKSCLIFKHRLAGGLATKEVANLDGLLEVPSLLVQTLREATQQFSPAAEPFRGG